jgi:hypothetical protein
MTEQELRALVREAIARHLAGATGQVALPRAPPPAPPLSHHRPSFLSYQLFALPDGSSGEGPCVIEPAVTCNHCGYCKSYGH